MPENTEDLNILEESEIPQNPPIKRRPVRAAAIKALDRIKQIQTVWHLSHDHCIILVWLV